MTMQRVPSHDAQNEFQFIMDQVCAGLGPVLITGVKGNAVLVREQDWRRLHKRLESLAGLIGSENPLDQLDQIVEAHTGDAAVRE